MASRFVFAVMAMAHVACAREHRARVLDAGFDSGRSASAMDAGRTVPQQKPVVFAVPQQGGSVMVASITGMPIHFDFPPAASGMLVTLTPTAASEIGWSEEQFVDVVKLEPDGAMFEDPVLVRPASGDVILLTYPSGAERSRPEPLPLAPSGDGFLLRHFSTLVVVAPDKSCGDRSGWELGTDQESGTHCSSSKELSQYIKLQCTAYAYCLEIESACCAAKSSRACHLGDQKLSIKFSGKYTSRVGELPYCALDAGVALDAGSGVHSADAGAAPRICMPMMYRYCDCGPDLAVGRDTCSDDGTHHNGCLCEPNTPWHAPDGSELTCNPKSFRWCYCGPDLAAATQSCLPDGSGYTGCNCSNGWVRTGSGGYGAIAGRSGGGGAGGAVSQTFCTPDMYRYCDCGPDNAVGRDTCASDGSHYKGCTCDDDQDAGAGCEPRTFRWCYCNTEVTAGTQSCRYDGTGYERCMCPDLSNW